MLTKTIRRISALAAVCLLFPLASCSKIPKSTKEEKQTVLTIDEYEVPYEQYRYCVLNYLDSFTDADGVLHVDEEDLADIREDTFTSLKDLYAVLSLCKKYGVDKDSGAIRELVNEQVEAAKETYESDEAYVEALLESHMNDSVFRFLTQVNACREELYYAMLDAGDVEPDDEKIRPLVNGDEFIRIKQILIETGEGESEEDNRARAEEARTRALAGEDFDKLVAEYGEDLYMFCNTDGYYMCRGVWYREFEEAAFALEIGEISDVFQTSAGFSVLMRCPKEKKYIEDNFDRLCDDYRDAQFSLALEAKAASMTVTANKILDQYSPLSIAESAQK